MWPWEHLLFGYALYHVFLRAASGRHPGNRDVVMLAFATQCPDLIDKPLAWAFGILPSGLSLAHSLLFASPICAVFLLVAHSSERPFLGVAFTVGYLSHLLGDVLFGLFTEGQLSYEFLFWPLLVANYEKNAGLFSKTYDLLNDFHQFLLTPRGTLYLTLEVVLIVGVLSLWASDGFPGVASVR